LILTKSLWLHCQAFYCTNKKGNCEKIFFFVIPLSTHRPVTTKNPEK
jgi:hypothetical protein